MVQISCLLLTCSTKSCVAFYQSNGPNGNRTWNVLTQTSSHNQPRNHDLAFTLITKPLVILVRHTPSWAIMGPCFLFPGYYSVHPRKGRVVLSQLPHVMWASGCWHCERTLYSRRPLKGTGVSIYLSTTMYGALIGLFMTSPLSLIHHRVGLDKCIVYTYRSMV